MRKIPRYSGLLFSCQKCSLLKVVMIIQTHRRCSTNRLSILRKRYLILTDDRNVLSSKRSEQLVHSQDSGRELGL